MKVLIDIAKLTDFCLTKCDLLTLGERTALPDKANLLLDVLAVVLALVALLLESIESLVGILDFLLIG